MFVFYDTETTGLDTDFSQIVQIALVFTDDNFNILSSKKLECRRSPWIVPSPGAMLITGFSPDDLKTSKLSHYEMMQEVYKWTRSQHWPVTFVGYNNIGFDEPLLSQNLHQNLLDPKLTSRKNEGKNKSNGRSDILTLVKATNLYMPGALKLDILNDYGTPSLSLLNVAKQNNVPLSEHDAHDAMNDIKATLGVAKLLKKAAPDVWEHIAKLSTLDSVDEFFKDNDIYTYAVSTKKAIVATSLLPEPGEKTEIVYDLSYDPAAYLNMNVNELKKLLLLDEWKRPFKTVKKENQPILMPMDLSTPVLNEKYDEKLYARRAKTLEEDKRFLKTLKKAKLLAEQEKEALLAQETLPEKMINSKFTPKFKDRLIAWMDRFNNADSWKESLNIVENFYIEFKKDLKKDPSLSRFVKFAGRIIYEHAPEELSQNKQDGMKKHIASRVLNPYPNAPYMTVLKARKELQEIEQARTAGSAKWKNVTDTQIRSLKLYYTAIEKENTPYLNMTNDNQSSSSVSKKQTNGFTPPKPNL